jgi:hypothetical protein
MGEDLIHAAASHHIAAQERSHYAPAHASTVPELPATGVIGELLEDSASYAWRNGVHVEGEQEHHGQERGCWPAGRRCAAV